MIKKVAFLAVVLGAGLILLELFLRAYQPNGAERLPAFAVDEQIGWSRPPNQHGFIVQRVPGLFRTRFQTNSRGMRDREYPAEKHGRHRILALGDSVTEGWGVEEDETYPKVLEAQYLHDVEVWNLGVVGYSSDQELRQLERVIDAFRPDVVTLAFFFNDLAENTFRRARWPPNYVKPHFDIRDGQLVLTSEQALHDQVVRADRDGRTLTALADRVLNLSALYRFTYSSAKTMYRSATGSRGGAQPEPSHWWDLNKLHQIRQGVELNQAWALSERILAEVDRLCASRGARFILTYVPQPVDGIPGALQTNLKIPDDVFGEFDSAIVEHRLADAARRNHIDFLPMRERFLNAANPASLFLSRASRDPHISAPGHQLVARALAEHLRRAEILPVQDFRADSLVDADAAEASHEHRQQP